MLSMTCIQKVAIASNGGVRGLLVTFADDDGNEHELFMPKYSVAELIQPLQQVDALGPDLLDDAARILRE